MKFSEIDLKPEILKALTNMGYQDLTPIQEKTFSPILSGRDLLARAETGWGKTAACGIPLVQMIDPSLNAIQVLILVPTRELALQYVEEIDNIAKHTGVAPFAIFGGFSMEIHKHQTLFFAATMPNEIDRLISVYLKEPIRVELNKEQLSPQSLVHHFQYTERHDRLNALIQYLKREKISPALLFCNSRHHGEKLTKELERKFKSIGYIHGGLEQWKRTSIFERFPRKKIDLLVATDLAGRGLDFSHVSHVINYDYPFGQESYTHRTGRTGRMGRSGIAMTFVTDQELGVLNSLLKTNRIDPVWHGNIPDLRAVHKPYGRRDGKKFFKKQSRPVSRGESPQLTR